MSEFPAFQKPNNVPLYLDHILLMHSSVEGHLGGVRLLVIVNNTAMNISVQFFLLQDKDVAEERTSKSN